MRSERWSTAIEWKGILKKDAPGPILQYDGSDRWVHDGEGHVMILGVSGSGKSRRGTIPMMKSFIHNDQSAVIADPKGEIYASTKDEIPGYYDVHVIDFRNLYEEDAEGWNPLIAPYELWLSKDVKDRHIAEQMVEELSHAMYPDVKNTDPFWIKESRNLFTSLVYGLYQYAKPEEINLASVYYLLSRGEERCAVSTYLNEFVKFSEENENISMQLLSYLTTANDTRGGIRSVFLDGLSIATKSESVRKFLSYDDLHINQLSGDKPTLIYIVLPDETPIYNDLTGVLISQLMNHYVRIAEQEYGGRLPIRVNVLLEELGNIGRAISNLPHLMTAGRSRNIRVELVLQSLSQLEDIYGSSNATTIVSNCDVRMLFRVNHWDTLSDFSRMCGEKQVNYEGHIFREPLITQSQLAAMETGQGLVIISGRTKFITWIPDYTEMYPQIKQKSQKKKKKTSTRKTVSFFDVKKYVDEKRKAKLSQNRTKEVEPQNNFHMSFEAFMANKNRVNEDEKDEFSFDVDELVKKIDKKIEELEAEEAKEKERDKKAED